MYLRWKRRWRPRRQEWAHYAELVECRWIAGRPRQRVVGYLASLREPYREAPAHRQRFWQQVDQRLPALGLAPATQQRLVVQLAQQVPRPTADELAALDTRRALLLQLGQAQVKRPQGP
jgi:hypothetical protein